MIYKTSHILFFCFCLILFFKYLNYFINILVKLAINFDVDNLFIKQLFFWSTSKFKIDDSNCCHQKDKMTKSKRTKQQAIRVLSKYNIAHIAKWWGQVPRSTKFFVKVLISTLAHFKPFLALQTIVEPLEAIFPKFKGSRFIFLVLYANDILLASNNIVLLQRLRVFSQRILRWKPWSASFMIGIQIQRDKTNGILCLSQKAYIDKVVDRYDMKNCSLDDTPVTKGDRLSLLQWLNNDYQKKQMNILYAYAVGSLLYAQVCTHSDIAYIIRKLGRYLCNLVIDQWKAASKGMWYLQRTKDYMLTYKRSDQLQLIGHFKLHFSNGRRSSFLEKWQADTCCFIYDRSRVRCLLWSFESSYMAQKFCFWVSVSGFSRKAITVILWQ